MSIRTIDYYTSSGLLNFERSAANYRLYPDSVVQTLERIHLLKNQRMSIAEIKEALHSNPQSEADRLVQEVVEEFNCLQKKIICLEEQVKDAPSHVKMQISKALESKMVAIASLLALL